MTPPELLKKIIDAMGRNVLTQVMIDKGIPEPLEDHFEIVADKGFLLFREIKKK